MKADISHLYRGSKRVASASFGPPLGTGPLEATAQRFDVREVSADKAYLSRKNLNAVEAVGAMPFIPFKSNTLEPTEAGAWARMYHLFMYQREAYLEHYHKRSNIETAYSMIKGKFGSATKQE